MAMALAVLILISFSIRLGRSAYTGMANQLHAAELERAAANIAREGSMGRVFSDRSGASAHLAPLYPLFLGGLYRIFGWDTVAGRWAQEVCAVAATTAAFALLPLVARKTGRPEAVGWAAAFILAVVPMNHWIETSGSWEQPYSALALAGLILLFCLLGDEGWRGTKVVVLAGGYVGLVALLAPSLLPAVVLMMAGEFLFGGAPRGRVVVGSLAILLVASLVVAPWAIRNYYALGGFVPLRSNMGLELANGNHSNSNGMTHSHTSDDPASAINAPHPFTSRAELAKLEAMGELAYMRSRQAEATAWIKAHPLDALRLTASRWRHYWFPGVDMSSRGSSFRGVRSLADCLLGAAALGQLVLLARGRRGRYWLLAAALVGPCLIYLVTHVEMRYRYPTYGLCVFLAVDLLASIWSRLVDRIAPTPGPRTSAAPRPV
jgi:hypothetical protein